MTRATLGSTWSWLATMLKKHGLTAVIIGGLCVSAYAVGHRRGVEREQSIVAVLWWDQMARVDMLNDPRCPEPTKAFFDAAALAGTDADPLPYRREAHSAPRGGVR